MLSYIIRRLLLMIPTIIGITFLVFMLIALAPGGIGAALTLAGGGEGAEGGQQRAIQEADLEDRFGLNDPVIVQYVRWLSRISPVKFGRPDQIDDVGELQRAPKPLKDPPLFSYYYGESQTLAEQPDPAPVYAEKALEERQSFYRSASNAYTNARARYVGSVKELEQALVSYANANELRGFVDIDDDPVISKFRRHAPQFDASSPEGQAVVAFGDTAIARHQEAVDARAELYNAWASQPFKDSVWGISTGGENDLGLPNKVPLQLGNFVHLANPDLGTAFSRSRPVGALIAEALPVTLLLNLVAFPIIYLVAVPTGLYAAVKQGGWFDITSGSLYVALWSIPVVWAGVLAVGYLANNDYLGAFPVSGLHDANSDDMLFLPSTGEDGFARGYLLDTLWHICLPVACLVYTGFAILSKQTRAAMLDNFNADYVRTAKAKGVAPTDVIFKHVFRNSLLPLITMFASIFPAMLAGSVVIENIFSIPGMGSLVLEAINLRDRELLLANALLIGVVNLLALLLADILYAMADPRITFD